MKRIGVFVVLLLACCSGAWAQPASLSDARTEGDRPSTAPIIGIAEPIAASPSSIAESPRLVISGGWLRNGAPDPAGHLSPLTTAIDLGLSRFAQPRRALQTRSVPGINRRLVAIPFFKWQHASPGLRNGLVTLAPSIAFGRRPTIAPDRFPGARTFGFAIHGRIDLDRVAPSSRSALVPAPAQAGLFAKVRNLIDQHRR